MSKTQFDKKVKSLFAEYNKLITRKNVKIKNSNGIYSRYKFPIITAEHIPLTWRYDFDYKSNPFLMERIGVNCTFNSGAIEVAGKILLGDRKSVV